MVSSLPQDDLSNLRTEVAGLKLDSSTTPQLQAVNQLKILVRTLFSIILYLYHSTALFHP